MSLMYVSKLWDRHFIAIGSTEQYHSEVMPFLLPGIGFHSSSLLIFKEPSLVRLWTPNEVFFFSWKITGIKRKLFNISSIDSTTIILLVLKTDMQSLYKI